MSSYCWQERGCDEEMQSRCPHNSPDVYSPCPMDCCYTACDKPQHKQADPLTALDPYADRTAAQKEQCMWCEFFLKTAPKVAPQG